jgi:hypothetical protein
MDKGGRSYRFNLRVAPDWMSRVRAAAEQRGISMADFVILVVNERLNIHTPTPAESEPAKPRERPKKDAATEMAPKKTRKRKGK